MATRALPFADVAATAQAYRDALAQGWPAPTGRRGARTATSVAARALGVGSFSAMANRLDIAAALGLDVPGWRALAPEEAEQHRRRYRTEDPAYRAWLADPSGPGPAEDRRAARRGEIGGPPIPPAARPPAGFAIKRNAAEFDEDGKLRRQWIGTERDAGEAHAVPAGHVVKGESALLDADGRVRVRWVKTREGAVGAGLVEALQDAFARFDGAAPLADVPAVTLADQHTIYPLADLHLGMYAWGRETEESYDLPIALDRARSAYRRLIERVPPTRSCTLLNLGDFFHANDQTAATPRSGHRLDVDGRWPKVLLAGAELLLELIDMLAQRHQEVEVVVLPGNHDPDAAAALRVALMLFYSRHDRIEVHEGPGVFWYRRFGRCLFGATHGHTVKQSKVAGVMASDRPEDWGATHWRAFFTAHIHHERAIEDAGVRVESLNTLASRDAYAHGGGWRAGHAVQAITYQADHGEVGRTRVNVLPAGPAARAA